MTQSEPSSFPRPPHTRFWELPPLILHPFSDKRGPDTLLECSRAQLMLAGILPLDGCDREELEKRVVDGRICEVRMLYYVGLDLNRWLDQCQEVVEHQEQLRETGLSKASFTCLLVAESPLHVHTKLQGWGVADYKSPLHARAWPERHLRVPPGSRRGPGWVPAGLSPLPPTPSFAYGKTPRPAAPATPDAFHL